MMKLGGVRGISKLILRIIGVFGEIVMGLIFIKGVGPGSF